VGAASQGGIFHAEFAESRSWEEKVTLGAGGEVLWLLRRGDFFHAEFAEGRRKEEEAASQR
jgi:hypothetical protein